MAWAVATCGFSGSLEGVSTSLVALLSHAAGKPLRKPGAALMAVHNLNLCCCVAGSVLGQQNFGSSSAAYIIDYTGNSPQDIQSGTHAALKVWGGDRRFGPTGLNRLTAPSLRLNQAYGSFLLQRPMSKVFQLFKNLLVRMSLCNWRFIVLANLIPRDVLWLAPNGGWLCGTQICKSGGQHCMVSKKRVISVHWKQPFGQFRADPQMVFDRLVLARGYDSWFHLCCAEQFPGSHGIHDDAKYQTGANLGLPCWSHSWSLANRWMQKPLGRSSWLTRHHCSL